MQSAILIVEDEALLAKNMQRYLSKLGYEVRIASSTRDAIIAVNNFHPDVVVIDYQLPDGSGLELLRQLKEKNVAAHTIFMTGHGSIQIAVDAMKAGAAEFITKPLVLEELGLTIEKLSGQAKNEKTLSYFRSKEASKGSLDSIIGDSQAIRDLKNKVSALAAAEASMGDEVPLPVLVTGETGTGKQLVARALHFGSRRNTGPFVELNCAALPDQLVESELFGHERGAFTDAKERKIGLFEAADGGTLFLDEVGELPFTTQAKLLKTLESQTIRKLGSVREQKVSVRVVAATNRDLRDMIKAGTFRSDLYFRLQMLELHVPPLRQRSSDILLLAEHFLKTKSIKYKRDNLRFSAAARDAIAKYSWPGNVRELRNVIERAILLSQGPIIDAAVFAIPETEAIAEPQTGVSDARGLFDIERDALEKALKRANWNVSEASRALGVSRDTLRYRMAKFDLKPAQAGIG